MTRRLAVSAAACAAVVGLVLALLPPRARPPVDAAFSPTWPVLRGAFHVHSVRSDGTGTFDEIAAAAARAGLQFVVFTDHGDGTAPPEPPAYRAGVLCVDGVEISTTRGHYAVTGMSQAPYPLAGDPEGVIEDVRRLGGIGFAAHPGSPKEALRWGAWDAAFHGIEWLNADSEWRDEFWGSRGRVLLTYPLRPLETLTALLDRPEPVLREWDRLTQRRRVPAIAGADAHARLGFRQATDPYEDRVLARVPSYEISFRAFVNHAVLDRSPTGDAAHDADLLLEALREGRLFSTIDGRAGVSAFEARATSGPAIARPGEYLDLHGPAVLEAQVAAPAGTTLVVLRDGQRLYDTREPALRLDIGTAPGVYRIEAHLPDASAGEVPWILANPFYVGMRERHGERLAAVPAGVPPVSERTAVATAAWRAEASPDSTSVLRPSALPDGTPAIEWRFALAGGAPEGQYAAIRFPLSDLTRHDRVILRVMGDASHRVWLQLRSPGAGEGERWGRTFHVGPDLEPVELRFEEFEPIGSASAARPPLDRIDSLLLVVDTVNTRPGAAGRLWIPDLWLAR